MLVDADRPPCIVAHPLPRHIFHDLSALIAIRQRQRAAGAQVLEFVRDHDGIADQYDRAGAVRIFEGDVLEVTQQRRVVEIRMEIEQRIGARHRGRANVLQDVEGLGQRAQRRRVAEVEPLQTVGDRPLKQRQSLGRQQGRVRVARADAHRQPHARAHQGLQDLRLVARLDREHRDART